MLTTKQRPVLSKLLAATLAVVTTLPTTAQQPPSPSKHEAAVRRKVDQLSPQARISVIPFNSHEEFGTFVSKNQEGFTFNDVDSKAQVTFRYADVRKVKDGYGGYNNLTHTHVDRQRGIIVTLFLAGTIAAVLIGAAIAARH